MDTTALFAQLEAIEQRAIVVAADPVKETFTEAYVARTERLKTIVREGTCIFREETEKILAGIFREIIQANNLDVRPLILLSRSPRVNAASYGDGVFVINVGLLEALDSYEELAFVMAHELAHDQLFHLRDRLEDRAAHAAAMADHRNRRTRRRRVRKEGAGGIMADLRETVYEQHRHGRSNELEADSLALQYLRNTDISVSAAVQSLDHLEQTDHFSLPAPAVNKLLNTTTYPFRERWVKEATSMFGGSFGKKAVADSTDFWQQDSLTTHPALPLRRSLLATMLTEYSLAGGDTAGRPHGFTDLAHRESVRSYLDAGMNAHALVLALKWLDVASDDYYYALAADALLQTHQAIGRHDFDRVIPPSRFFANPGANAVVRMLQQMRTDELKKLTMALLTEKLAAY
ncbi:MAG: M48 family metalloprotease, partial [Bacteroidota bacterium]